MKKLNEGYINRENLELILRQYESYYYSDEVRDCTEREDELLNLRSVNMDKCFQGPEARDRPGPAGCTSETAIEAGF